MGADKMASSRTTVSAKCDNCKAPLTVRVGFKSTAREIQCRSCGVRYDYSCWRSGTIDLLGVKDGGVVYHVEFLRSTKGKG